MIIDNVIIQQSVEQILSDLNAQMIAQGLRPLGKTHSTRENVMVCCPYIHGDHYDHNPSAGIRTSDGFFHCFACGKTVPFAEFISHCLDIEDGGVFGWKWLLQNYVSVSVETRKDLDLDMARITPITTAPKYVSEEELKKYKFYHQYMWDRHLTREIVDMFDVGYDSETDSLTFPVRDITGGTLFVARRSVKGKRFNYPQGVEKPLYGIYELSKAAEELPFGLRSISELIICESMLDALSCWVYGAYAVALNGLGTELQYRQLHSLSIREFVLATDNDEAGMKAREKLKREFPDKIITQFILPEGRKDMNELSRVEFNALEKTFA